MKEWYDKTHSIRLDPVYGDWRLLDITNKDVRVKIKDLIPLISSQKLVDFGEISFKGRDLPMTMRRMKCVCCDGEYYKNSNIRYPCILVENCPNPHKLKYRMVDGKHRIERMISLGKTEEIFNIITYPTFKEIIKTLAGENLSDDN